MATTRNENANDQLSRAAEAARDTGRESVRLASENTQRWTDQAVQFFGLGGESGQELARQSTQNLNAVTQASTVLARGFRDVSHECLQVMQEQLQRNVDGFTAVLRCRSVQEVVAAQSEFVRNNLEQTIEGTRRLAEVSTRVANETLRPLASTLSGVLALALHRRPGRCIWALGVNQDPVQQLWTGSF